MLLFRDCLAGEDTAGKLARRSGSCIGESGVAKAPAVKRGNMVSRLMRETIGELRKVNWPTRQEAIQLTIIVLIVVVATSAFLGLLDYIFTDLVRLLVGL
jgi:preprotein translocase subunit SecE